MRQSLRQDKKVSYRKIHEKKLSFKLKQTGYVWKQNKSKQGKMLTEFLFVFQTIYQMYHSPQFVLNLEYS